MEWLWGALGLISGSVANALIYRIPKKKSWVKGKSVCPHCGHALAWIDLIPLLSYLSLRGKCRYCHKPIGLRYLLVEIIMAAGFAYLHSPILAAILFVTVVIAFMDWEVMLVSDALVLAWLGLVVGSKVLAHLPVVDVNGLLGAAIGAGVIGGIWAVSRGRAMGFGDVEIGAVMGYWLGWPGIGYALWLAFVSGAIAGGYLLLKRQAKLKSQIAFGPFLILGAWAATLVQWSNVLLF